MIGYQFNSRDEVPENLKWDLSGIFATDEAFEEALSSAKEIPARLSAFKDKVSVSPDALLAFFKEDDDTMRLLSKIENYASRKSDQDTRVAKYQDYTTRVRSAAVEIYAAESWFTPEILSMDTSVLEKWYEEVPELRKYKRNLDMILANKDHTLTASEERLLSMASEMSGSPENIYSMLTDADLTFPDAIASDGSKVTLSNGSFVNILFGSDRGLRKDAHKKYYTVYGEHKNAIAAALEGQFKQLNFFSKARKFDSMLEAALSANEVPTDVYLNLIKAVNDNLSSLHKYIGIRKRVLEHDDLGFMDIYQDIVSDVEMSFTFEEACELIQKALAPLGEDYLAIVKEILESKLIDVCENPGKRGGAYSAGGAGVKPYILMNFHGTLNDVFTLIHEMGHSVHTYLSDKNQPVNTCSYPIFVAEVASTCNESLLIHYMLEHCDDDRQRAYLINHFLEQFKGTLFRQTHFAEFELECSKIAANGEGLTAERLTSLYGELNSRYYGSDIITDEYISLEWARIPHFYYNFYVYQYATGYAAAVALSTKILKEGSEAAEAYKSFLKGGCSKSPIELLKGAGVDMSTPKPVTEAIKLFDSLLDEIDSLI